MHSSIQKEKEESLNTKEPQITLAMKIIYCPCKDEEEAERIGQILVEEKIVACTNSIPITSCYLWEGRTEKTEEVTLLCKTIPEKLELAIGRIKALHSYKIPAIVVLDASVNKEYEDWMRETLRS